MSIEPKIISRAIIIAKVNLFLIAKGFLFILTLSKLKNTISKITIIKRMIISFNIRLCDYILIFKSIDILKYQINR